MKPSLETRFRLELPEHRGYDIVIGPGLLARAGDEISKLPRCRDAFVITDENVASLYQERLETGLAQGAVREVKVAMIPPGEGSKTVDRWVQLQDELIAYSASGHRQVCVVAFGGGVVGDLAGFVAATFRRGVPLVQIPTTLVAMVDAAIGGKTGVDHPRAKNMIGAFHQPRAVLADPALLRTLEERDLLCGMAEVIKTAWIKDPELADLVEKEVPRVRNRNAQLLARIVERCAKIKAGYVEQDEFDRSGVRAELNFGHTIGHALEAATGYGKQYRHGEAVAVGVLVASDLARRLGMVDEAFVPRLEHVLERYGLPTRFRGCGEKDLVAALRLDKKNIHGTHRFVLPRAVGEMTVVENVGEGLIVDVIRGRMEGHPKGLDDAPGG